MSKRTRFQRIAGWTLVLAGLMVGLFGVWAVGAYVWELIAIWNEPDRSWIFWGLAVLFIGLFSIAAGAALAMLGARLLKRESS